MQLASVNFYFLVHAFVFSARGLVLVLEAPVFSGSVGWWASVQIDCALVRPAPVAQHTSPCSMPVVLSIEVAYVGYVFPCCCLGYVLFASYADAYPYNDHR